MELPKYDEINLVEPGFNSGWRQTMGLGEEKKRLDPNNWLTLMARESIVTPNLHGKRQ